MSAAPAPMANPFFDKCELKIEYDIEVKSSRHKISVPSSELM
eukprot:gene11691-20077_t